MGLLIMQPKKYINPRKYDDIGGYLLRIGAFAKQLRWPARLSQKTAPQQTERGENGQVWVWFLSELVT